MKKKQEGSIYDENNFVPFDEEIPTRQIVDEPTSTQPQTSSSFFQKNKKIIITVSIVISILIIFLLNLKFGILEWGPKPKGELYGIPNSTGVIDSSHTGEQSPKGGISTTGGQLSPAETGANTGTDTGTQNDLEAKKKELIDSIENATKQAQQIANEVMELRIYVLEQKKLKLLDDTQNKESKEITSLLIDKQNQPVINYVTNIQDPNKNISSYVDNSTTTEVTASGKVTIGDNNTDIDGTGNNVIKNGTPGLTPIVDLVKSSKPPPQEIHKAPLQPPPDRPSDNVSPSSQVTEKTYSTPLEGTVNSHTNPLQDKTSEQPQTSNENTGPSPQTVGTGCRGVISSSNTNELIVLILVIELIFLTAIATNVYMHYHLLREFQSDFKKCIEDTKNELHSLKADLESMLNK